MSYDTVNEILHGQYGWGANESPARGPVETALQNGASPQDIADRLETFVRNASQNAAAPHNIAAWGEDGKYKWFRWTWFATNCKYDGLNANIALGFVTEIDVPHEPEAKTVAEWWAHLSHNRNRLGYPLLDLNDPDGQAEQERRLRAVANVPFEWGAAADIYKLAVLNGDYPVETSGFYTAYAQRTPKSPEAVAGLTDQMYLDNLRCADRRMPPAWQVVEPTGKVPA